MVSNSPQGALRGFYLLLLTHSTSQVIPLAHTNTFVPFYDAHLALHKPSWKGRPIFFLAFFGKTLKVAANQIAGKEKSNQFV